MGNPKESITSFLGSGWSFPPSFSAAAGRINMSSEEKDIEESLRILLGTTAGERFLNPKYGLDMRQLLFEPMSETMKTYIADGIRIGILIYEARINLLSVVLDTSAQYQGVIAVHLEYEIRATNSRYNLVYPFYLAEGGEARGTIDSSRGEAGASVGTGRADGR
ncbi:phage baseplate outer wedge protein (acidic lysozyme), putative [Geotalea daltonii FRC-32]|uniref:Phage baseplate outer wedge protein (Acidic lysozyme), putative n=2 Tax=Geotalea TaxID=2910589 RepID=B9M7I0_GEODF|nr:phage baseplate outer wedge protein (acidic lysozyme), putative [Geotalea daltonii FRC-32]